MDDLFIHSGGVLGSSFCRCLVLTWRMGHMQAKENCVGYEFACGLIPIYYEGRYFGAMVKVSGARCDNACSKPVSSSRVV